MDLLRQIAELVGATVFENESRSNYQVTNRSRYAGFPRMRYCCDPGRDVTCDAGNLPSRQMNLPAWMPLRNDLPSGAIESTIAEAHRTARDGTSKMPTKPSPRSPPAQPPNRSIWYSVAS